MKKKWILIGLPIVTVAIFLSVSDTARRFTFYGMSMAASAGAKLACSGVYAMGREPDEVIKRDLRPFYAPLLEYASFDFDLEKQTAEATMLGLVSRTALYRPGVGCTVMIDTDREELLDQSRGIEDAQLVNRPGDWPEGDVVTLDNSLENIDWLQLEKGITGAFEDNTENKIIDTRAIIVVYEGRIIAEQYADGFDGYSRFMSWSASKSITSALIGTLVTDGKLALHDPAPVHEWASESDPRHAITLHHLLTMTSGLEFSEPYLPGNDSTDMLFKTARMGDFAAGKPLFKQPGELWAYSSGTTNLLSRILFDTVGGNLKSTHDYVWERFFEPVGMTSAIFDTDVFGSHVGSSFFYASARDWARFGLLYLNEGKVGDRQILSKEWVEYSHTPTPLAPKGMYGAQFWLNGGHPTGDDEGLMMPDCPKDMYMASGYNEQRIAIVPSKKAVVVRLGWTTLGARFDTNKHFSQILAAIPDKQ